MNTALYTGVVTHRRFRPKAHSLRYRMLWLLADLDEMEAMDEPEAAVRKPRLFSHNRFNVFSFHDRDHLDGSDRPLRSRIEALLDGAGIILDGGRISVLSMPRVFGAVFNPISLFFCRHRDGGLRAMLYEVNNTFGQRHLYLIPVGDPRAPVIRQDCVKRFHVSPFLPMAMTYRFTLTPPDTSAAETMALSIDGGDAEGRLIHAAFHGIRQDLTDAALLRALPRFGALAAGVVAGIHWEALKLWLKGLRLHPAPPPPDAFVTAVPLRKASKD